MWRRCSSRVLSTGIQTQQGTRGDVKEGLESTLMGSFNVGQRDHYSGPGSYGVPDGGVDRRTWLQLVCCAP